MLQAKRVQQKISLPVTPGPGVRHMQIKIKELKETTKLGTLQQTQWAHGRNQSILITYLYYFLLLSFYPLWMLCQLEGQQVHRPTTPDTDVKSPANYPRRQPAFTLPANGDRSPIAVVRGGGDIATGTVCRLHNCGFRVVILEIEAPLAIRRSVSLSEAVYDGKQTVEDVTAVLIQSPGQAPDCWNSNLVPILIDGDCSTCPALQPAIVVDAILAKRNLGTSRQLAPVTVGLGPGFQAGVDVDAVVETMRGHQLGRVLYTGSALANTGRPGTIGGYSEERVIYAKHSGQFFPTMEIGSRVSQGETIAAIGREPVTAPISGILRGIIRPGTMVREKLKIGDIDPRVAEAENTFLISDKARAIAGGVLEAILHLNLHR